MILKAMKQSVDDFRIAEHVRRYQLNGINCKRTNDGIRSVRQALCSF